jgi:hypothetical protein
MTAITRLVERIVRSGDPHRQIGFRLYLAGTILFNSLLMWATASDRRWTTQRSYRFLTPFGGAAFLQVLFLATAAVAVVALISRKVVLANAANLVAYAKCSYLAIGLLLGYLTDTPSTRPAGSAIALSVGIWGFIALLHFVIAGLPLSDYWQR